MKTKSFVVTINIPDGCTVSDAQAYARSAVKTWCGSYDPESPEFELGRGAKVSSLAPLLRKAFKAGSAIGWDANEKHFQEWLKNCDH